MTLEKLTAIARRNLNDKDGSIFTKDDLEYYINEAIDRIRSHTYFRDEVNLLALVDEPISIPEQYHHLLAVYASARSFAQDERHYQATTFMNEFEVKFEELLAKIESGEITITDGSGVAVEPDYEDDFVENVYFDYSETTDLEVVPEP